MNDVYIKVSPATVEILERIRNDGESSDALLQRMAIVYNLNKFSPKKEHLPPKGFCYAECQVPMCKKKVLIKENSPYFGIFCSDHMKGYTTSTGGKDQWMSKQ